MMPKQYEGYEIDIEALWVREAEARYDEIATGKVVCRPFDEAVGDARKARLNEADCTVCVR